MGTSKNDMMMILQLAKTFLAKKFKLKKGGDPFAKLGRAWQEPQCKAIAVFFGVRSALRVKNCLRTARIQMCLCLWEDESSASTCFF